MEEIFAPIKEEMLIVEQQYHNIVSQNKIMAAYCQEKNEAKMFRPAIVLLTAGLCGKITSKTQSISLIVEMLHNSSLIHDDVIDNGQKRRNKKTINALYGNQLAVLIGDYILSKTMKQIANLDDSYILQEISHVSEAMIYGELLQLEHKNQKEQISIHQYLDVITNKTAILLASCFKLGAYSAEVSAQQLQEWYQMGLSFGIAFQIADDISDYDINNIANKDANKDILEHKITLPLITALQNMTTHQQKEFLMFYFQHNGTRDEIEKIVHQVIDNKGIDNAIHIMNAKAQVFSNFLKNFPNNNYRHALSEMLKKIVNVKAK